MNLYTFFDGLQNQVSTLLVDNPIATNILLKSLLSPPKELPITYSLLLIPYYLLSITFSSVLLFAQPFIYGAFQVVPQAVHSLVPLVVPPLSSCLSRQAG